MLLKKNLHALCRPSMFRPPAPLQRKLFPISTDVERAGIPRARGLRLTQASSVTPKTDRRSPVIGDRSYDQRSSESSPSLGSGGFLCNNAVLSLHYSTPLPSHGPPKVNSHEDLIGKPGYDGAPKPWREHLVRFERYKRIRTSWNRLRNDKGITSYDWRIPLIELEKYHDQKIIAEEASWPNIEVPHFACKVLRRPPIRQKHAALIKRHSVWTASTFMAYVHDLTTSSVDRSVKHQLYGKRGSHSRAVSNILERLFNKVATKDLLSAEACNAAMRFFFKHNQVSKARAIFVQMEKLHQETQTPSVNIMLLAAANRNDLHNFTFILTRMLKWGFKPDAATWNALLVAVESNEVRAVIIKSMRQRNLLAGKFLVKGVVKTIIRDEMIKHLKSGFGLDSFFSSLDRQYGTKWLSVSAANNFLDEAGKRKGIHEVIGCLDDLIARGFIPDDVTLGTLLQISRLFNEWTVAIDLLQRFESQYGVVPAEDSYNILFGLAWNGWRYNLLRVIWRSACVKGLTSRNMRRLVLRSLRNEEENPPEGKRHKMWKDTAGAVVVGISPPNPSDQHSSSPKVAMADVRPNEDEDGAGMRERLEKMVEEDLATEGRYRLKGTLVELLRSALALDDEWIRSRDWKTKSVEWKCKNAITTIATQLFTLKCQESTWFNKIGVRHYKVCLVDE